LSGGQKQRANLARALTLTPRLIVCDEVVAALDVSIQAEVVNLLIDLQAELGMGYVFISHDLAVVSHLSERTAVMYLGSLVELGPATEVAGAPLHPYTAALQFAAPELMPSSLRGKRPAPLQGELPSPLAPPSGCGFRTRCPKAAPLCASGMAHATTPAWRGLPFRVLSPPS
jgi:oligopeptide/dipeptide ABC transporter ATP-binding protein